MAMVKMYLQAGYLCEISHFKPLRINGLQIEVLKREDPCDYKIDYIFRLEPLLDHDLPWNQSHRDVIHATEHLLSRQEVTAGSLEIRCVEAPAAGASTCFRGRWCPSGW